MQNPEQPITSRENLKFYAPINEKTCSDIIKRGLSKKLKVSKLDIRIKQSGLKVSNSKVPSSGYLSYILHAVILFIS